MHQVTKLYLLCSGQYVSDTALLAGDIVIQCFVFFQLDSNDIWVRAGRFSITDLTFHLMEPVKQLINVPNNLQ
jgi:hypothetical protein